MMRDPLTDLQTKAPTIAQLRADIDGGRTGEKVGYSDPAAAPLGTDDEAAGQPPTARERRLAQASAPRAPRLRPQLDGRIVYGALAVMAYAVVLAAAFAA